MTQLRLFPFSVFRTEFFQCATFSILCVEVLLLWNSASSKISSFFHVEIFQISMRDKCEKIWNLSTFGVIQHFAIWKMCRNLKFLNIWHVCDEENASTCVKFMLLCCKIGFVAIYALLLQIFVSRFTRLCVDKKLTKNYVWGEKWQIWDMEPGWIDVNPRSIN